jgi:glucose-1-phosphate thymidylyltransferase
MYLEEGRLFVEKLPRGFAWLDTGTFDSLSEASNYVETIEKRTGQMIACLEEIGFNNGWLTKEKLQESIELYKKNSYGEYLKKLIKDDIQ